MNELCPMPGWRVDAITPVGPTLLHIAAHATRPGGRCPDCGRASRAVHSRCRRHPADLPSMGRRAHVGLRARRFYCRNAKCARRTFAERLAELVAPHARWTARLALRWLRHRLLCRRIARAMAQGQVGVALGGEAAARLLHRLAMPASPDTVLRLVRGLPLPASEPPRVVAVDDWATRRGRSYGTTVVAPERRRAIDLLPDRTSTTVADWLQQRPGIEVVARDRSTEYARAATVGAPKAVQVADRWHLLANVRDMLERWLAAYEDVRRRYLAGEALLAIGRATGLARATVRKHAHAESSPERAVRRPGRSILDPLIAYLQARLVEGCKEAMALWREVQSRGYAHGPKVVQKWVVAENRARPARRTPRKWLPGAPASAAPGTASGPGPALPSPKQLAWLLVRPATALPPWDAAAVRRSKEDAEAAQVASLARRFTALVRACGDGQPTRPAAPLAELNAWLTEAHACGVSAVETFAAGLEQDGAAVRAALTEPWSSGQAEGQINRLKMLKRQSYGRAGFDRLRRRVLIAV